MRTGGWLSLAAIAGVCAPGAGAEVFSMDTISGHLDLRLAATNGERSWAEDGFGKTRFNGAPDGLALRGTIAEAEIAWAPRFTSSLSGAIDLITQPGQRQAVAINQAYLSYKSSPAAPTRLFLRAGYYYPEISLEHDNSPAWTDEDMITPSAINSWIGEEGKVIGGEAKVSHMLGGQEFSATLGTFIGDDTAGTLLTFRGWALHDLKATAQGTFPLPPLSDYMEYRQDPYTESSDEIDNLPGYYVRAAWAPNAASGVDVFYYDNKGDRKGVERLQWAWATHFWNVGAHVQLDERTKIMAQALTGRTTMGFRTPQGLWADVDFHSAYLLAQRLIGENNALTARVDYFEVDDNSLIVIDNNDEHGWAATGDFRRQLTRQTALLLEALYVDSDRPSRALAGEGARQATTSLQASFRVFF